MIQLHIPYTAAPAAGAELQVCDLKGSREVWLAGDEQVAFTQGRPDVRALPVGSLNKQAAVW
jgi:hypothetical protein